MAILTGDYPPLLGGVTEQHAGGALPNQLLEQLNMVTDPVTGLRRRPGAKYRDDAGVPPIAITEPERITSWHCEVGGQYWHFLLISGELCVYNSQFKQVQTIQSPYLEGFNSASDVSWATLGGDLFILNRTKTVELGELSTAPALVDPVQCGFLWIRAGAFSKKYSISVTFPNTVGPGAGNTETYAFTTPSGTTAGDSDKAAPEWIASQLAAAFNAGTAYSSLYVASAAGPVVVIQGKSGNSQTYPLDVQSGSGSTYVSASHKMQVPAIGDLPPSFEAAVPAPVAVGSDPKAYQYYYWDGLRSAWLECGKYGSHTAFKNMPIRIHEVGGALQLDAADWPARFAGDDNTNDYPNFAYTGKITGISSFQGRLVLMSGNYTSLSDSKQWNRMMRSTVNTLLDSDSIEIAAGSTNSAQFKQAVAYNRDLILFADTQISVIPGSNVVTPKSAQVVPTSSSDVICSTAPVQVGNAMMYPTPGTSSAGEFSGFGLLVPSQYTTSQYEVELCTPHLPTFFPGEVMRLSVSSAAGVAVVQCKNDPAGVFVYQYLWSGGEQKMAAWHRWEFKYGVHSVHCARDQIVLLLKHPSETLVWATLDTKQANSASRTTYVPYLDFWQAVQYTGEPFYVDLPPDPAYNTLVSTREQNKGQPLSFTVNGVSQVVPHRSGSQGNYAIGVSYESAFSPNVPVLQDQKGSFLLGGTYWEELEVTTRNSGAFNATVTYQDEVQSDYEYHTLSWDSPQAVPDSSMQNRFAQTPIPILGETANLKVRVSTSGTHELCVSGLGYTIKTAKQFRRV